MDLFDKVVDDSKLHPNFKNILVPSRDKERRLFSEWAKGFIDRDKKLVKEFQTTFNSTFWEIYLYRAFVDLGFVINWNHASPDFEVSYGCNEFIVEATTANAAIGKVNEWEQTFSPEELKKLNRFKELNREAIIRLSNAVLGKDKKYSKSYSKLAHVKGKPFVIAVAPFEQPNFNLQYTRPINALLYDDYVDEDVYLDNPELYPNGPPTLNLGFVEKDNGAEIALGFFTEPGMENVSAVIFSCTATWGKLSAMTHDFHSHTDVYSVWSSTKDGIPVKQILSNQEHHERVIDGLQIFHNPFAKYPLSQDVFKRKGIVQTSYDIQNQCVIREGLEGALFFRRTMSIPNRPITKASR